MWHYVNLKRQYHWMWRQKAVWKQGFNFFFFIRRTVLKIFLLYQHVLLGVGRVSACRNGAAVQHVSHPGGAGDDRPAGTSWAQGVCGELRLSRQPSKLQTSVSHQTEAGHCKHGHGTRITECRSMSIRFKCVHKHITFFLSSLIFVAPLRQMSSYPVPIHLNIPVWYQK